MKYKEFTVGAKLQLIASMRKLTLAFCAIYTLALLVALGDSMKATGMKEREKRIIQVVLVWYNIKRLVEQD